MQHGSGDVIVFSIVFYCDSEDIMVFFRHVTLQDHVIKVLYNFIVRSSSR